MTSLSTPRPILSRSLPDWVVFVSLLILCFIPTVGGIVRLVWYETGALLGDGHTRFLGARFGITWHIVSVSVFCVFGIAQFAPRLRRQHPKVHRWMGRTLVPFGLMSAASGLWLTLTFPWEAQDSMAVHVARLIVGSTMLFAFSFGWVQARRRKFHSHGAWMLRGYAFGMGAGTQALIGLPFFMVFGDFTQESRAVMMLLGWGLNAFVVEALILKTLPLPLGWLGQRVKPGETR